MALSFSILLVAAIGLLTIVRTTGGDRAYASSASLQPKVLVLTMFDLETQPWLDREHLTRTIDVPAIAEPLHCDPHGRLCVATIGEGKVNAATSVSALLNDQSMNLAGTYVLTSGIAGTSPNNGTLGFAAWSDWVVDYDLGHHVSKETDPTIPNGYLKGDPTGTNAYQLNPNLVHEAYALTKNVALADDKQAAQNRAQYPGQKDRKPFVTTCAAVTGDDFWIGKDASETADYIVGQWTNGATHYCTSEQEDNATAGVLQKYGYLDHYLSLRTASDFDQPFAGQSAADALSAFPGANIAVENAYRVASVVAHHLAADGR